MSATTEAAFETVIKLHLLANGYIQIPEKGFAPDVAIFSDVVLSFIRASQPKEWKKLEALHGKGTGELVIIGHSLFDIGYSEVVTWRRGGRGGRNIH